MTTFVTIKATDGHTYQVPIIEAATGKIDPSVLPAVAPTPTPAPSALDVIAAALGFSHPRVFGDTFAGPTLDLTKWAPCVASRASNGVPWNTPSAAAAPLLSWSSSANDEEFWSSANLATGPSGLVITAEPDTSVAGKSWRCGALCTYGRFQMASGLYLVRARMPDCSSGLWPGIWCLPGPGGTGGDRGEIDIHEGGFTDGTTPVNEVLASHYDSPSGWVGRLTAETVDLSTDFHVYGVKIESGQSITFYLDGKQTWQVTSGVNTDPYQLIIDLSVASSATAGWHSTGTPPAGAQMVVSEVAAYTS